MTQRQDQFEPQRERASSDDADEIFDRVDDHDRVVGHVRRGDAHRDPHLIHRSVQVLIFDDALRLLLQRRSDSKDLFPGYLCASASGHVIAGESYATAARREMAEELGAALPLAAVGTRLVRSRQETEMTAVFVARGAGPFHFHATETQGGVFVSLAELQHVRRDGSLPLTPALLAALEAVDHLVADGALPTLLGGPGSVQAHGV